MQLLQALATLIVPSHFKWWYLADAVQLAHLFIGVLAFSLLIFVDDFIAMKKRSHPVSPHVWAIVAMIGCSAWEFASWLIYGAFVYEHIVNSLFMATGAATAWAIWQHKWRLMGLSAVLSIIALLINVVQHL